MKITINSSVDLSIETSLELARNLINNRKPKEGSFNYGFETHNVYIHTEGLEKIQVYQTNTRTSDKSPIVINIERHTGI